MEMIRNNRISFRFMSSKTQKKKKKKLAENRHYHYKDHWVIDESWSKVVTKSSFFFLHWFAIDGQFKERVPFLYARQK